MNTQEQPYRRALAVKALQWVFCAFKPLTIDDLAQAVALDSDGNTDTVVTATFLLQICGSFIIVTNSGSVKFAHRSVKEYLMRDLLPGSQGFEFSFSNAHAQVAETCLLLLLSFEDASKWARLPTNFHEEALGLNLTGFEMYACFFWASHCEKLISPASWKRFEYLFDRFFAVSSAKVGESEVTVASTAFQKWINLLWRVFQTDSNLEDSVRRRLEDAISDPPTPLFAACIWGFDVKAVRLMARGTHNVNLLQDLRSGAREARIVNPNNHRGKSCLYLACENGHKNIVLTLYHSQAIADGGHERWGSYLHAAASSGRLESFVGLLERGAEVNTPEGFYGRTIDAAIRGGNPAILTLALNAGAEVWLPSAAAPIQPRDRRSRSLHATETSSSGTLSGEDSVLADSTQNLITPFGVPSLGNKDSRPSEHYDLLERLRKASLRRRELLNYRRLAFNMAAVDHRVSDERVIAEEASGYHTAIRQESAARNSLPIEGTPVSHNRCYLCFQKIPISVASSWR